MTFPELVAENHDMILPALVFSDPECTAELGIDAQHVEVVGGNCSRRVSPLIRAAPSGLP